MKTQTPIKRLTKKASSLLNQIRDKFVANETRKGNVYMDFVCIPNDSRIIEMALEGMLAKIEQLEGGNK